MKSTPFPRLRRLLVLLLLSGALPALTPPCAADTAPTLAADAPADAPEVLLASVYDEAVDPANYWVSEKLDGVRALWDGKELHFRSGRRIHAPSWFTAGLPAHPLDGELWIARQHFDQVSAAVRRAVPLDAEWRSISYQVFEWPGGAGTFTERSAALKASVARTGTAWLRYRPQFRVADRRELQARLDEVIRGGGEGLVLHRADAAWQTGRGDALLKLKPQPDAEAKVVGYVPGKGKYAGMCGALLVEAADGKRFRLGSGLSDAERRSPPPVGSVVTYRYRGYTKNGLPRFASFMRIRLEE
jgi:DNA ligase 1